MSSGYAVLLVDESGRLVGSCFGVAAEQIPAEVGKLKKQHPGPGLRVFVNGRDMTDAVARTVAVEPAADEAMKDEPTPIPRAPGDGELATAELAHYMLWESFKRSCQVQSYMLDKMTGCAVEMNRRFVQELETMRGNYTKALERIDGIEFEKRMIEHEAASRRLSTHYVRLAEEDHRAAERRRDDERSVLEQIARGVMRVVDVIGSDSINGSGKN